MSKNIKLDKCYMCYIPAAPLCDDAGNPIYDCPCDECQRTECIGADYCLEIIGFQYWRKNPDYLVPPSDLELPDYYY